MNKMSFNTKTIASLVAVAFLASSCSDPVSDGPRSNNIGNAGTDFVSQMGPNGDRVFFALNKSDVTDEGQHTLTQQAGYLNAHPEQKVVLEGHCDVRGSEAYNMGLGERRANAAKNYLVALGVIPTRTEVVSYGKGRPADLGNDETAHAKNRRAVTVAH
jgi:peptidoglycan-associated lipoprotein